MAEETDPKESGPMKALRKERDAAVSRAKVLEDALGQSLAKGAGFEGFVAKALVKEFAGADREDWSPDAFEAFAKEQGATPTPKAEGKEGSEKDPGAPEGLDALGKVQNGSHSSSESGDKAAQLEKALVEANKAGEIQAGIRIRQELAALKRAS